MVEIILTAIMGVFSSAATGTITYLQTKKKYDAETNGEMIANMQKSLDFYKSIVDDNKERLEELQTENEELRRQVEELKSQLITLMTQMCVNTSCEKRIIAKKKKEKEKTKSSNKSE